MAHPPSPEDPHGLERFEKAQSECYGTALAEIKSGKKRTHWMWFVFPQLSGLGFSPTSQYYAIRGRSEAEAYLAHPVLGPRLVECCQALLKLGDVSASEVFGYPDDLKLRSSMTLFSAVSPEGSVFSEVLDKYFGGEPDSKTLDLLSR